MDLKPKSPKKSRDISDNIDEWILENNLDYDLLTESGNFFIFFQQFAFMIELFREIELQTSKKQRIRKKQQKTQKSLFRDA